MLVGYYPLDAVELVELKLKLNPIVEKIVLDHQLELVEFDLFEAGGKPVLKVFIYKDGGVSVDDCSRLSRDLGNTFDLDDLIPFAYQLEVSSPGLDRPLKEAKDFLRNKERSVKVQMKDPELYGRKIIADIVDADDEKVTLAYEGSNIELKYDDMLSVKIELKY